MRRLSVRLTKEQYKQVRAKNTAVSNTVRLALGFPPGNAKRVRATKSRRLTTILTTEQYKQLQGRASAKNLTISDFVRLSLGFPSVNHPVVKRIEVDFDLPRGGLAELSRRIGCSYGKLYRWRSIGVPVNEAENIKKVIEEIRLAYVERKIEMTTTNGYLGKLPHGALSDIANKLNRPYNTVRNWHKYGIPVEHRASVKGVREGLGL